MLGAISRVYDPGHKFDYGKQRGWVREGALTEVTDPDGFMPVPEQMEIPFT